MADERWTIDELSARVAVALAANYAGPPNHRVRDVPDLRTIRYYTTLGLIDRPVEMDGRTALYGRRHLMQLVAIKRLQARGLSLAEVQERLLGLTVASLAALARLPADIDATVARSDGSARARSKAVRAMAARQAAGDRAAAFWKATPSPRSVRVRDAAAAVTASSVAAAPDTSAAGREPPTGAEDTAGLLHGVPLAAGLTLLIAADRQVDSDDIEAIRVAAAPLTKLLKRRRLLGRRDERRDP